MRSLRQHLPTGASTANDTQVGDNSPRNITLKVTRASPTPSQTPRATSRQRAPTTTGLHSPSNSPMFRPSPTLQANSANYISDARLSASALTWRGYARRTTPIHSAASSDDAIKLRQLIVGMFGEFRANPRAASRRSGGKDSTVDMLSQFQLPPAHTDTSRINYGELSPDNPSTTRIIGTAIHGQLEPILGIEADPFNRFQRLGSPNISDGEAGEGCVKSARLPSLNPQAEIITYVNPNQHIADYLDYLFDSDGQTPLFIAISKGSLSVFKLLAYDIGCICPPPPHTLDALQGMASIEALTYAQTENALRASSSSAQGLGTPQVQFFSINGQSSSAGTAGSISEGPNNQLFQISASSLTPRMQATINIAPQQQAQGPPVMLTKNEGRTALHCAAHQGNAEMLAYLLTTCGWGWDIEGGYSARTETRSTGGEGALGAGGSYSSIPTLGSDANRTALHCAVANGHIKCVRALSEAGCNLNAKDGSGHTALIIAVAQGDREMTSLLLSLRGGYQRQVLPPIKSTSCSMSRSSFSSTDMTGGLLGRGALLMNRLTVEDQPSFQFPFSTQPCDPFAVTRGGYTAVRLGAQRGMQDLFMYLQ